MATTTDKSVTLEDTMAAPSMAKGLDPDRSYFILGMSDEMKAVVDELASRYDCSMAEIINRAVCFLRAVSDEAREGKRVGVVDGDQELDTEYVGFH